MRSEAVPFWTNIDQALVERNGRFSDLPSEFSLRSLLRLERVPAGGDVDDLYARIYFRKMFYQQHQTLVNLCRENPMLFILVYALLRYVRRDKLFLDMGMYGGCDEVRQWRRVDAPAAKSEMRAMIRQLDLSREMVSKLVCLTLTATPENFLEGYQTHPQSKLTENYKRLVAGELSSFESLVDELCETNDAIAK